MKLLKRKLYTLNVRRKTRAFDRKEPVVSTVCGLMQLLQKALYTKRDERILVTRLKMRRAFQAGNGTHCHYMRRRFIYRI